MFRLGSVVFSETGGTARAFDKRSAFDGKLRDVPSIEPSISPDGRFALPTQTREDFSPRNCAGTIRISSGCPTNFKAHSVRLVPGWNHVLVGEPRAKATNLVYGIFRFWEASRKLTDVSEGGTVSPDGTKIAFLEGQRQIHSSELWLDADGSQCRKLYAISGYSGSLAWSPNGKRWPIRKRGIGRAQRRSSDRELTIWLQEIQTDVLRLSSARRLKLERDDRLFFYASGRNLERRSNVGSTPVDEQTGESRGRIDAPHERARLEAAT